MCWCRPEIRTPFCGRPECHPPVKPDMETRTIPAGTVVHMQGMPVELVEDTKLRTHPGNWKYALEKLESEVGDQA